MPVIAETKRESVLRQYADGSNLNARQALYRFRRPGPDLFDWALSLAELRGDERVVDAGCGTGNYVRALEAHGHRGPVVGIDLSAGMQPHVVGDLQQLPVRRGWADVALCMHVLYHLPDQAAGAAELRRVVRPGGRALLVTNGADHLREMDGMVEDVAGEELLRTMYAFKMETGADVLRTAFDSVEAHHLRGGLDVTDADAVVAYVRSAPDVYRVDDVQVAEVRRRVQDAIDRDGAFTITTATGCFVCR